MKKYIFLIIALISFSSTYADDNNRLYIYLKSGDIVVANFDDAAKTTFEDGIVTVGNERYQFSNISKFTYGSSNNAIKGVQTEDEGLQVNDRWIVIRTKDAERKVSLYGVDGKQLSINVTKADDTITVNVESLPVGVYLLKVGSETIKFRKR